MGTGPARRSDCSKVEGIAAGAKCVMWKSAVSDPGRRKRIPCSTADVLFWFETHRRQILGWLRSTVAEQGFFVDERRKAKQL